MDIKPPPQRPKPRPALTAPDPAASPVAVPPNVSETSPTVLPVPEIPEITNQPPRRKFSLLKRIILAVLALLVFAGGGLFGWYTWALRPVSAEETKQTFVVTSGQSPSTIAAQLEEARLIRSAVAFGVYVKLHGQANQLQAGTYTLSPNQSVASIVDELVKGQNAVRNVIIPPGVTLKQLADPTVTGSFAAQGFSAEEIQQAFQATYSSPLLKDKPADATLEGYIFPETFQVKESDSLQNLIQRSLDELYAKLQAGNMIEKFAAQGLNIHQAVTLASIIQKEVTDPNDQRQVAQVFLKRLREGILLGSDVTFVYAANQAGVTPSLDIDSPYNTRKYAGLPPGPIANMNFSALEAVAEPAAGDYLYFVSGDGADKGKTFFSRTYEEHKAAIAAHCRTLCSLSDE